MPKTGILIAGSLYWSDRPHRVQWRKDHLRQGSEIAVDVPIRYGRLSSEGSYTMVFAPACPLGRAKIIECQHSNNTIDDVIREAQALWLAESRDGSPRQPTLASNWGCVALLANPASALPRSLFDAWAARVAEERYSRGKVRCYDSQAYAVQGRAAISDGGLLQIAWPVFASTGAAVDSFDLLLATATKPTPDANTRDYPNAERIAAAWRSTSNPQYFLENRKHGFHTFQDDEIIKYL
jgi:hypothetical protein